MGFFCHAHRLQHELRLPLEWCANSVLRQSSLLTSASQSTPGRLQVGEEREGTRHVCTVAGLRAFQNPLVCTVAVSAARVNDIGCRQFQRAGREGFEPSRELYTPYPLSRRVLSATQPPPRQGGAAVRFYRP